MMASRRPSDEDEPLELTPDMEADEPEEEAEERDEDDEAEVEGEPGEGDDEGESPGEGEDEGIAQIGFDDDEPAAGDSSVIRTLRERNKQLAREVAEARNAMQAAPDLELPDKPTLADCDYDEDKFEAALTGWHNQRQKVESARAEQARIGDQVNREWQRDMDNYVARRDALALPDFEDSAEVVKSSLNLAQQAVILKAASDSAAFVYALGRSAPRTNELAKIQDPIKLAAAVARMEGGLKVVKKRKVPAPDKPQTGGARMPGSTDKQLAKLEEEATRTGDRTKVISYKKKLAARGKK